MNKNQLLVVFTVGVVALIAVVFFLVNQSNEKEQTVDRGDHVSIEGQPTLGDPNAKVSIVEFGDYKCPSCKQWGEMIYPQLKEDYLDNEDVSFSYINVLFHGQESILASLASESVYKQDPDSFWAFHKALYAAQPEVQHDEVWVTVEKLKEIASETTSVDLEQFEADLGENSTVLENVSIDDGLVKESGVQFTPSIMINGVMLEDPFDYDRIKQLIEQDL